MLVNNLLEATAQRIPHKIGLIANDVRLTYAEIDAMAERLAAALVASGVERGDRVIVYLDNSIEAIISIFGILKTGAVFSVVNPTTKAEKLGFMLKHIRPVVLITQAEKMSVAASVCGAGASVRELIIVGSSDYAVDHIEVHINSWQQIMSMHDVSQSSPHAIDTDLAAIVFTSGSTGNPKAVMCAHMNVVSAARSIASYLENCEEDVILNVLQLSASYGLYQVLVAFMVGATVIIEKGFSFPFQAVQLMQREGVTGFAAVPTIWSMFLSMRGLREQSLPKLRYLTNAGAGLPVARVHQVRDAFPQAKLYLMYGQTECVRVCYLEPNETEQRPDSVGKAMPNSEVYIVDQDDRPVKAGEVGELVVRGSHVMRGYWEDDQRTSERFRPARRHNDQGIGLPGEVLLFTNDLFRMDDEGYLYFVGRTDDIIKSRGEKVAPKEIEQILYHLDAVEDAAVVGVPDDVLGEAIKLCVVVKPGMVLDERSLREYCRLHLEDFMLPKYVELWPEFPKNANGKLDRKLLQAGRASYEALLTSTAA